jgi:hypothetical protein
MQTNKALVGLVIGLGAIIVIGVGLLVYGFVQKAADPSFSFFSKAPASVAKDTGKAAQQANITVPLPPGTSVVSVARADDLLMVHTVDEDDNSALLFIDPADGHIVRRIAFGGRR